MQDLQSDPALLLKYILALQEENRLLREENKLLKEEYRLLKEEHRLLKEENAALKRRISDLEEKLNTNSRNSSKSPSQDPYRKRKGKKKPSGKKQGAQPGHKGCTRDMVSPEKVSGFREIHPQECPHCGGIEFSNDPVRTEVRQITELPDIQPQIIQFNIHTERCSCCGHSVKADIPKEAESAFGPRLKGFISLLSGDLGLTKRKVVSLTGYLNIKVSVGSVCSIHHLVGEILEKPYGEIKQHTLEQTALHADETSWYHKGKRQWLWIVTGSQSAFFKIDPSRSAQVFQDLIGEYQAPLTTDRYAAYSSYDGPRQNCWSHLDRDFAKIADRGNADGFIGNNLKKEADQVFSTWRHFQEDLITRRELQTYLETFVMPSVQALFLTACLWQSCNPKTQRTCKRLLSHFDHLWTYLYYEGVEPTNNLAERDIRPSVIQRKLSYGTQSDAGVAFTERMLSVSVTFKKQAKNLFEYLISCFEAHIREGSPPSPL